MLKLRTDTVYVAPTGKLVQAGYEALQGQFDDGTTRIAAVEAAVAGSFIRPQTAIVAASQTSMDFTGVPTWVNRVTVTGFGVSTNGTSNYVLRIGDGAIVTSGYLGSVTTIAGATPTSGTVSAGATMIISPTAASVFRFMATISRVTGNNWVICGSGSLSNTGTTTLFAAELTLSGALDRVRLTTGNGTDTFDAGTVNIAWE